MRPLPCREEVMQLMNDETPRTTQQITDALSHLPRDTVKTAIRGLHRAGELHIADWVRHPSGKKPSAIWGLGGEEDAENANRKPLDTRKVVQSIRAFRDRFHPGPFLTSMWNLSEGERP